MESNLAVKIDTTVPVIQPLAPVLHEVKSKVAKYVWKTGKSFFLSKRQTVVVETFIETRNIAECRRALIKEMGKAPSYSTINRLLKKDLIAQHIAERMEELGVYAGWTKERWFKVMTDHIQGKSILASGDLYAMNLIGKFKGWGQEGVNVNFNQPINFVQSDGRA